MAPGLAHARATAHACKLCDRNEENFWELEQQQQPLDHPYHVRTYVRQTKRCFCYLNIVFSRCVCVGVLVFNCIDGHREAQREKGCGMMMTGLAMGGMAWSFCVFVVRSGVQDSPLWFSQYPDPRVFANHVCNMMPARRGCISSGTIRARKQAGIFGINLIRDLVIRGTSVPALRPSCQRPANAQNQHRYGVGSTRDSGNAVNPAKLLAGKTCRRIAGDEHM